MSLKRFKSYRRKDLMDLDALMVKLSTEYTHNPKKKKTLNCIIITMS